MSKDQLYSDPVEVDVDVDSDCDGLQGRTLVCNNERIEWLGGNRVWPVSTALEDCWVSLEPWSVLVRPETEWVAKFVPRRAMLCGSSNQYLH